MNNVVVGVFMFTVVQVPLTFFLRGISMSSPTSAVNVCESVRTIEGIGRTLSGTTVSLELLSIIVINGDRGSVLFPKGESERDRAGGAV